ncbi:nucleoside deaminase [Xanthocytophaga agilis]|uniref:Nucleoside deaminase n=1 Tax=Xanthocytophaga agilis TaxID=3048010 RepID=A0AAE3R1R9_9BACT|nr:nucleoside deaminase [Xanthocytophaga agilis]MDJ1500022.1 nucleoside deaminase [Xanthocytophaga agilis]
MSIPNPDFMREAIQLSLNTMRNGNGGPFGAVIVKDEQIIARGYNRVLETNDPTAHAEVVAIREATQSLGTFDLEGCEIYTSCEPCPMCLGAIYWSHISKMYYANTKADAAAIGFDDHFIYDELDRDPAHRRLQSLPLLREEAIRAFEEWATKTDKQRY